MNIPAELVLLLTVRLPGTNINQLTKALPYALEEFLIDDIESQYFVLGPRISEQEHAVAVIEKTYLDTLLKKLHEISIFPTAIYPDSLLLPCKNNEMTLVEVDGRILLRKGLYGGMAIDKDNVTHIIDSLNVDTVGVAEKINLYNIDNDRVSLCEKMHCVQRELTSPIISILYHDTAKELNLLPEQYHRKNNEKIYRKKWFPAAAAILLWFSAYLLISMYDYIYLSHRNNELQESIKRTYLETFPDSKKVVDAEVQMRQKLSELRMQRGNSSASFKDMLVVGAPIIISTPGLRMNVMRYQNGRLEIEVELSDLQNLEQLKSRLKKANNWNVEIQSATSSNNKVVGQILITGAAL